MQTERQEAPSFPEDDWLLRYEEEVRQIALRRVVQVLFLSKEPIKLAELLSAVNASINSVAAAFQMLKDVDAVEMLDGRVSLTKQGRRVVLRDRRRLFFPRVTVHYRPPDITSRDRRTKSNSFVDGKLPDVYRLAAIDTVSNDG